MNKDQLRTYNIAFNRHYEFIKHGVNRLLAQVLGHEVMIKIKDEDYSFDIKVRTTYNIEELIEHYSIELDQFGLIKNDKDLMLVKLSISI